MKNLNIKKIQNYKNITKALLEKTSTIAKFIENICDENGISSLLDNKYLIKNYSYDSCKYIDLCLIIEANYYYNNYNVCVSCDFVDSSNQSCYRNGSQDSCYKSPTRNNIKTFIKDLPEIFKDIDKQINSNDETLNDIFTLIKNDI